jgi:hypothetical protein
MHTDSNNVLLNAIIDQLTLKQFVKARKIAKHSLVYQDYLNGIKKVTKCKKVWALINKMEGQL